MDRKLKSKDQWNSFFNKIIPFILGRDKEVNKTDL